MEMDDDDVFLTQRDPSNPPSPAAEDVDDSGDDRANLFRFGKPLSHLDVEGKLQESTPVNTRYKQNWAINAFSATCTMYMYVCR